MTMGSIVCSPYNSQYLLHNDCDVYTTYNTYFRDHILLTGSSSPATTLSLPHTAHEVT